MTYTYINTALCGPYNCASSSLLDFNSVTVSLKKTKSIVDFIIPKMVVVENFEV